VRVPRPHKHDDSGRGHQRTQTCPRVRRCRRLSCMSTSPSHAGGAKMPARWRAGLASGIGRPGVARPGSGPAAVRTCSCDQHQLKPFLPTSPNTRVHVTRWPVCTTRCRREGIAPRREVDVAARQRTCSINKQACGDGFLETKWEWPRRGGVGAWPWRGPKKSLRLASASASAASSSALLPSPPADGFSRRAHAASGDADGGRRRVPG